MSAGGTTAAGLALVGAGAGSGKTRRLTSLVTAALDPSGARPIQLQGLVAVTYTCKAAAELEERIRQTLIAAGARARARELPLARLGTVHAVCLRWLRELALDAGLSPLLDVLPGDEALALRQALETGLPNELRKRLDDLATQLEIGWDPRTKRTDWLVPVQDVMALARGNRIPPAALPAMGERSWQRLERLMGEPEPDGSALDARLASALDETIGALARLGTRHKITQDALKALQQAQARLAAGTLRWSGWIGLQNLDAGKAARDAVTPLTEAAGGVDRHPRLHAQLRAFVAAVYEAASRGLTAYEAWKRERRLLDFGDMVDFGLTLLDVPEVRAELANQLELCVVDEFQDTSPVQLALFVKLHQLCRRSVWVGDPKQCIFEYAGADPALMDAVADWIRQAGGSTDTLLDNWRSRPELVAACSRLFSAAFARHGLSPEQVAMQPRRASPPELASLPPLGVWWLHGSRQGQALEAVAEGVSALLRDPERTPIVDRASGQVRSLRPSDVAVLVYTNAEAEGLAAALATRGVRCAVSRAGLLDTPEGTLVQAALSHVSDRSDLRSLAIVEALTAFAGQSGPDAWLAEVIARHARTREAQPGETAPDTAAASGVARALEGLRHDLPLLAPSEVLDRVLAVLDAAALCARWPDPAQRLSNLDALRALAARYEARCRHQREAASIAGLLRFFEDAREKLIVRGEERTSDDQHATFGAASVTVTTYHRSKGLEWPVVVLASLDREERRNAFSVLPVQARGDFDPTDPLGGRWIRYWPWPYGLRRNAPLADAVASSPEGQHVRRREARERVRLLYVGFTRARDHLVLAVRAGKRAPSMAWLDELCDSDGAPLVSLPAAGEARAQGEVTIRGSDGSVAAFAARVCLLEPAPGDPTAPQQRAVGTWFAATQPVQRLAHRISPSRARLDWPELEAGAADRVVMTGPRLPLGSEKPRDWSAVGDALHAFLAADVAGLSQRQRQMRAQRLLGAAQLLGLIEPEALLGAADRFRAWVQRCWPGAVWHRELPVSCVLATALGKRRIDGVIDLLLELPAGVVIIDHKSYPGRRDTWRDRAREHAPQLAAYAEVLRRAGKRVLAQWINFTVGGGAVRVNHRPDATHEAR